MNYISSLLKCIFFLNFAYHVSKNKKVKQFFYDAFYCVDDFLKVGNILNNEETIDETQSEEPAPSKRFEDKYLDEYNMLESVDCSKERLDGLKNTMIMENTPIGNVIMFYDNQTENFVYYSDLTMPYRYLEVIGRKYVTTFKCKNIFVDMNKELKLIEEKKISQINSDIVKSNKKDVFAKFKTYNNNVTKEAVSAPSKNAGITDTKKDNESVILKDKANRYRYEGKLANLNFLQPVDKKHIDKRLSMSWAEYKNKLPQNIST